MTQALPNAPVHNEFGSLTFAQREVRQVRNNISKVFPRSTPFFSLLDKTATVSDGKANEYEWQSISDYPRTVTLTAAASNSATTLTVASTTHITESQLLMDMSSTEQMIVASVTNATTLVVFNRGQAGGSPQALSSGQELVLLGRAREEGDERISATGIIPDFDSNFFQQFEHVLGITDRAQRIMYYGGSQDDLDQEEGLNEYKKGIERQFLFGFRQQINAGSNGATTHPRWMCGGAQDFIRTDGNNVFDAGGAFTYSELNRFMVETIRTGNSGDKFGFASLDVMRIMSEWTLSSHQADMVKSTLFGTDVQRFKGTNWTLSLIHDEQFETATETQQQLYILDMKNIRHHIMSGLGDTINEAVTGPRNDGSHTVTDQITGTHTLEFDLVRSHAIIDTITS